MLSRRTSFRHIKRALAAFITMLASAPAFAGQCKVSQVANLPVTLIGRRALVDARFGDHDAHFIVDSGAFYSTLARASAAEFELKTEPMPGWFRLRGINGDTSASYAQARNFSLAGVPVSRANFIVGGSDTGKAGLLGQNILGLADVEYDLPHGSVRLMRSENCGSTGLAYWAGTKPFSSVTLERGEGGMWKPHTIGTVTLNGVKLRAVFDSGSQQTIMTLAAAKRAGITPQSPGVVQTGFYTGLGAKQLPTWVATFDSIDVGGEAIPHPRLHFADMQIDGDMLVGFDFFLTHRLFVSNASHRMDLTYEGGPFFGIVPGGARTPTGERVDLTDTAATPTDAEGLSRRAAVLLSKHRLAEGLADLDKAVAMAPTQGRYVYLRAQARLANSQPLLAANDLDRAVALMPNDVDARMSRARLRLDAHDPAGAADDVAALERLLPANSDHRLLLAGLDERLDQLDAAIGNYDAWLRLHRDDADRSQAFNGRCWARALLGRDLETALSDCNMAVRLRPGFASYLDSRALVHLRLGRLDAALADYNAAIAANPRNAWSRYGRSIVEARNGRHEEARTDELLARSINSHAVDLAVAHGLIP